MPLAESFAAALAMGVLAFATFAHFRIFTSWTSFAGQGRLVDLELNSLDETDISRDAVTDREGDEVSGNKSIGKWSQGSAITDEVAVVRDQLVQRFERLL